MAEQVKLTEAWCDLHVGRSWEGHPIEDGCPCPKEACGLVSLAQAVPECEQHSGMKTIRQSHTASDCPGAERKSDATTAGTD